MKITRIIYDSFIIAVILKSRNYLKVIKRNIKKHNLRSTATVSRKLCFTYFVLNYLKVIKRNIKKHNLRSTATMPRKLCFKYFVFYLKIGCP